VHGEIVPGSEKRSINAGSTRPFTGRRRALDDGSGQTPDARRRAEPAGGCAGGAVPYDVIRMTPYDGIPCEVIRVW
jgi:hypothetical protein